MLTLNLCASMIFLTLQLVWQFCCVFCTHSIESVHDSVKCRYLGNITINNLKHTGSTQTVVWAEGSYTYSLTGNPISPSKLFQSDLARVIDVCSRFLPSPCYNEPQKHTFEKVSPNLEIMMQVHCSYFCYCRALDSFSIRETRQACEYSINIRWKVKQQQ